MGTSVLRTHRIRGFIATMSLFFVLEGASLAQTLHAVIVTDSTRSDLALGADESVKLIKTVGVGVARSTNMSYAQILISDESISASKISRAVEGLKVTRDDVVFFYYFGHGLRSQSGGDLPALFVGPDASAALDANEIFARFAKSGPGSRSWWSMPVTGEAVFAGEGQRV